MPKELDDLQSARAALMDRMVDELAVERGLDLSEGLAPDIRHALVHEIEVAYYDEWFMRFQDGELVTPQTPVEFLMAELYSLDDAMHEAMEGGRGSCDTLQ